METSEDTKINTPVAMDHEIDAAGPGDDPNTKKRPLETGEDTAVEIKPEDSTQADDANPSKRPRIDEGPATADNKVISATDADNKEPSAATEATTADNESITAADAATTNTTEEPKLSKNKLRKQRRQQIYEERKETRKQLRKDKRHEKTAARREVREAKADELAQRLDITKEEARRRVYQMEQAQYAKKPVVHRPVPVAIIIDCDFEKYMLENELISLASQVTRSYAMNRTCPYTAHLLVSSWGGKMRERFETTLKSQHVNWKGVSFVEGDFVEAGKKAFEIMHGSHGGKLCPALGGPAESVQQDAKLSEKEAIEAQNQENKDGETQTPDEKPAEVKDELKSDTKDEIEVEASEAGSKQATEDTPTLPPFSTDSIVYLSADSPNTLDKLEPHTSYVIGGLVDRNREKFLCQRRAEEKGIRTAKLPIGEYLQMSSRKVLATNHVVEIMAKWLETGDWAKAFMEVIPQRKGVQLKNGQTGEDKEDENDEDEGKDDDDQDTIDAGEDSMENVKQEESASAKAET